MSHFLLYFLCIGLTVLVESATFWGTLDTSSGYCNITYGEIKVGDTFYGSDENCVRIICYEGGFDGASCGKISAGPGCKEVKRSGPYPSCCNNIECNWKLLL